MPEPLKTRAAQYLRMSTEHQRYSLAAQAQAIEAYAAANGYGINRTYFDPGESGVTFENRVGLQALLSAALDPGRSFEAILVLDVTRWGRFQDIDQPAHYEYLCRSAGVRVIYCAEPFDDDGSPVSSILKTLKRIMAAEFSRELSVKAHSAHIQQARLGFYQGGTAVYGVRRVVVDPEGRPRAELARGVRKAFAGDRVILQRGPPEELAVIRHVFRRYVRDERGPETIARELNRKGVLCVNGGPWLSSNVCSLLRNELAIGLYVTNKTSQAFGTRQRSRPTDEWVRTRVFPPIVKPALFRAAQEKLGRGKRERLSEPLMLEALRRLLRQEGRLNARLLNRSPGVHVAQTYRHYFGSLNRAYDLIGYVPRRPKGASLLPRREYMIAALREAYSRHGYLTAHIVNIDPALPVIETYQKHFGSLSRAYELAGLPHERKDLLRAAHRRSVRRGTASAVPGSLFGQRAPFSDAELLQILRETYARCKSISPDILESQVGAPRPSLYRTRFGSIIRAYELAGLPQAFLESYRLRRFTNLGARPTTPPVPPEH
ncbi:recombinase family protein [Phenylobacterium sp. LjRoot225]|uniref:recombinase family protein n=1 Tax=Phenylobacterium sp. LjRoot225 TaxID=3342285 RepID=UPI003ECE2B8D